MTPMDVLDHNRAMIDRLRDVLANPATAEAAEHCLRCDMLTLVQVAEPGSTMHTAATAALAALGFARLAPGVDVTVHL